MSTNKWLKWSKEEKEILSQNWGKIHSSKILELLPNRTYTSISKKASELKLVGDFGIGSRKYNFNRNFFDELTNDSCYWAGFIAADGNLNQRDVALRIVLSKKDRIILEEFKAITLYNNEIRDFVDNGKEYSKLEFYGAREWHKKLKYHFNIVAKKSLILEAPNLINLDHCYSFIIGYLDGDGTCKWFWDKKRNKNTFRLGFTGTKSMLKWIRKVLQKIIKSTKYHKPNKISKYKNIYRLNMSGGRGLLIYKKLLEVNLTFRLPRKWNHVHKK